MKTKRLSRTHPIAYLMIAPAYLSYVLFILIPVAFTIVASFTNYNMYNTFDFVGLKNYANMAKDKVFIQSVRNTLVYTLSLFPSLGIALFLANFLNRKSVLAPLFRTVNYLPNVASMVATSMIWLFILDPVNGLLNQILQAVGLRGGEWLSDPKKALYCLVAVGMWRSVGYFSVIFQSGIMGIPADLYEAGELDGANAWKQFLHITWPMLRPTTFFLFITGFISCFSVFEQVNVMTSGGPINSTTTIVHQIYRRAFMDFRMGYGSAMAVSLLAITFGMTLLSFRFGSQGNDTGTA